MTARLFAAAVFSACMMVRADAEPACGGPGTTAPAAANPHVASDYPLLSVVLHEEGTTTLSFVIGTDGKPGPATVVQSSGSLRLDDASREAVRSWIYTPGHSGSTAVPCMWNAQVKWAIPDDVSAKPQ
ncbi:MAG TPA: energy transducer TonB [Rhizomicrobium sp.]|nr:energy transducer TonB [Rhizomicrobium sp.]